MVMLTNNLYQEPAARRVKIRHNASTFETQVLIDDEIKASIVDGLPRDAYRFFWREVLSRIFPNLGLTLARGHNRSGDDR